MKHLRNIKRVCLKTYEGGSKIPYPKYSVTSIPYSGRDPPNKDQHQLHPINSIQVAPQIINGSQIGFSGHSGQNSN